MQGEYQLLQNVC